MAEVARAVLHPINIPDENDCYFKEIIEEKTYNLRFAWNAFGKFWKMSVHTDTGEPIVQGIKLVPNVALNATLATYELPYVVLMVLSKKQHIGRKDFVNGTAVFGYISVKETLEALAAE